MRSIASWMALQGLGVLLAPCHAQSADEARQSALYLYSVEFPRKADVCESGMPGFLDRFRPAFEDWVVRNKDDLARGEAFLRAEAAKANMSFERNIDALASNDAKSMAKASSAMILENCNWMLQTVTAREK